MPRNGTERLAGRSQLECGSYDGGTVCAGPVCTGCTTSRISETCLRHTISYFRFRLLKSQGSRKDNVLQRWSSWHPHGQNPTYPPRMHDNTDVNAHQLSQLLRGPGKYTLASLCCTLIPSSLLINKVHIFLTFSIVNITTR